MCMVSNVGDGWANKFPEKWPHLNPPPISVPSDISRGEIEALRKEVQELRKLLIAAKKFDEATGQPDCEMEEKVKLIKAIAKLLGVDMAGIFEPPPKTA